MSRAIKFGKTVKEIRLHLCQTSTSSQGVRDFIEKSYVEIKKTNPSVPFLIRECQGVQPKLWARLCDGKEQCINLKDHNDEQVFGKLAKVAADC